MNKCTILNTNLFSLWKKTHGVSRISGSYNSTTYNNGFHIPSFIARM